MMESIGYFIELLATLCGFDAPATISLFGVSIVILAFLILIYAFYRAAYLTFWPEEFNKNHIKYRILVEEFSNED